MLAAAAVPSAVFAWGKTGHRIVGAIAETYLTPQAKVGVAHILGPESMAEASTWPDEMRASPDAFWQKDAGPYHIVIVPKGKSYAEVGAPLQGDAVTALKQFSATVRDPGASLADKQLALRFIIHIVGDLHQPMHVNNGIDRGGNDVKLTFGNRDTNLHALWDSGLIDQEQLSYSEWTAWLRPKITPAMHRKWNSAEPLIWIAEGAEVRDRLYPDAPRITPVYALTNKPILEEQLEKGGVRLAAYLNQLFARAQRTTVPISSSYHRNKR
ncbi:S1/P1 nuclease [Sphingomonas sp. PAMC 26605]|uniref:S1/P1 nuclease n=1 Tax=Sphingomonas sp. PAMC 26605 TaxID=1112214 RepID=UPI00030E458A|nr:S1/P1 nuclease [Sphingomonas sp. PAMC 26605]